MATWIGDDRDTLLEAAAELAEMYADAERRLTAMLALQVKAGLASNPDDMVKALRLAELRDAARQAVTALEAASGEQVQSILQAAASDGAASALREMSALASVTDLTAVLAPTGAMAASALTLELTNALSDVTRRILRWPDDVYRQVIAGSATDVLLGLGATTRSAQAKAWQALVDQGVTGFVDKAGRRWNLATYVEMATRTATRRAWDAQHERTMLDAGLDLVSIIVGSDACQACAEWAGKVLRLTPGPIGQVQVLSAVADEYVTVNIAGTIEGARDNGWQHPNCRCRQVAYLPGLSTPADATTYDADLEGEREQLRALERAERKAKSEAAAALTPDGKRAAGAKVRETQAQIREHVAETGLVRKRFRESPNLGQVNITTVRVRARSGPGKIWTAYPTPEVTS